MKQNLFILYNFEKIWFFRTLIFSSNIIIPLEFLILLLENESDKCLVRAVVFKINSFAKSSLEVYSQLSEKM